MKTPPLRGIRALELAEIWAGPFCGVLLGDMGAEVIKVEALQRIARGPISPAPNTAGYPDYDPGERPWNRQGNFNATNRNKLGLTLDLTTEQGVSAFKELVAISDIVFTNYAFGVMDRLGLGHEVLRRIKPDLIVLFTPGYGNTGPYRGAPQHGHGDRRDDRPLRPARLPGPRSLAQLARASPRCRGRRNRDIRNLRPPCTTAPAPDRDSS